MNRVVQVIHRIVYYASLVGMVLLLLMMLLTVADVTGRSIFNSPIPGAYELTAYMLVAIILLGISYTEQRGRHIGVEIFFDKMPRIGKIILSNIFTIMALFYFSVIIWQGWIEGIYVLNAKTSSDIWRIPAFPFKFLIPFGALLLAIELILNLIPSERERKRREKKETVE